MYKHRYNNLVARLNTYRQQWTRIREIEEDVTPVTVWAAALHKSAPLPNRPPRPMSPPSTKELERVYAELVEARRSCHLPIDGMSREQLAATPLRNSGPLLSQKLGTSTDQFRVVVEGGKPKIKAGTKTQKLTRISRTHHYHVLTKRIFPVYFGLSHN